MSHRNSTFKDTASSSCSRKRSFRDTFDAEDEADFLASSSTDMLPHKRPRLSEQHLAQTLNSLSLRSASIPDRTNVGRKRSFFEMNEDGARLDSAAPTCKDLPAKRMKFTPIEEIRNTVAEMHIKPSTNEDVSCAVQSLQLIPDHIKQIEYSDALSDGRQFVSKLCSPSCGLKNRTTLNSHTGALVRFEEAKPNEQWRDMIESYYRNDDNEKHNNASTCPVAQVGFDKHKDNDEMECD